MSALSGDLATTTLPHRWIRTLVSLLGAFEVLMALGAGSALTRVAVIIGGLALAASPWVVGRVRGTTLALLVVGTVPLVAFTSTSIVSPVLVVLAWILMGLTLRDPSSGRPAPVAVRT